jgi:hypothetical protein
LAFFDFFRASEHADWESYNECVLERGPMWPRKLRHIGYMLFTHKSYGLELILCLLVCIYWILVGLWLGWKKVVGWFWEIKDKVKKD